MKVLEVFLLSIVVLCVDARHPDLTGNCDLEASELGPDWYKVPQPIPTVFAGDPDYMRTFIHMPCAATTVFDVAICGCTNLMSFLYSTIGHRDPQPPSSSHHNITAPPGDWVKTMAPSPTTKPPPAGSLLLNTKTGEIRQCPFKSSPRGPEWYLMHEPNDAWRPMRCAPGTLFYKKHCTCVHAGAYSNDNDKPEDSDIVVLEEDELDSKTDEKKSLSNALGISASDVKFEKGSQPEIPRYRTERTQVTNGKETDVVNTRYTNSNKEIQRPSVFTGKEKITIPFGKDAISTQHKLRLLRKGPIPFIRKEAATLTIDSKLDETVKKVNVINVDTKVDLKELDSIIESMKKEKLSKESKNFVEVDAKDHVIIFAHKECSKRPIPELGPQFFQLYIYGFGLVPYICNGDRVYDDSKCACVLTPTIPSSEVNFPITECHKRAAPELGPEYFQMYQWGYGFTPYRCHRDLVYNSQLCACSKP